MEVNPDSRDPPNPQRPSHKFTTLRSVPAGQGEPPNRHQKGGAPAAQAASKPPVSAHRFRRYKLAH
jgi:hypothetical protein